MRGPLPPGAGGCAARRPAILPAIGRPGAVRRAGVLIGAFCSLRRTCCAYLVDELTVVGSRAARARIAGFMSAAVPGRGDTGFPVTVLHYRWRYWSIIEVWMYLIRRLCWPAV